MSHSFEPDSADRHRSRPAVARRDLLVWGGAMLGAPLVLAACQSFRSTPTGTRPTPGATPADTTPPGQAVAAPTAGPAMPDLTPPRTEPTIRIRVLRRNGPETVAVGAPEPARWLRVSRADGPVLLVLAAPVRVTPETQGWAFSDGAGVRHVLDGRGPIELGALRGETPSVRIESTEYAGSARFVLRDDGGVDVINVCPMESYLPGVLARELYADWRYDTFVAQAVAARSFACTEMAFWRDRRHFDVVAGQASQAYVGRTGHATSNRAVTDTRGAVLVWEGKLVPGYYSSSCGGVSASAADAISDHPINHIPPLAARPPQECCNWAPTWRWSADRTPSDSARRLVAWASMRSDATVRAMREVTAIEPIALNEHGRPVRYRVRDRTGESVELRAEQLRHALNHSDGSIGAPKDPIRSSHFAATLNGATLRLTGRGFGHGAGMCQYGAEGMARRGVRWAEILANYYRSATVLAAYR